MNNFFGNIASVGKLVSSHKSANTLLLLAAWILNFSAQAASQSNTEIQWQRGDLVNPFSIDGEPSANPTDTLTFQLASKPQLWFCLFQI